jgi:hypothetical protein
VSETPSIPPEPISVPNPDSKLAEERTPMLDVHPAHHAATTWRDFFIHIATIVLGLIIAVSLEQTVEYFHHRHLAQEARKELLFERNQNETANNFNIFTTERHRVDLRRDLAVLRAVKTHAPLPAGPFIVRRFRYLYLEDAWRKIHQSGTVNYLAENLGPVDYRYTNQESFMSRANESDEAVSHASSVLLGENDPPQTASEINVATTNFTRALVASQFTLDEKSIQQGYATLIEHYDLSQLTPAQIDELERAIRIALADDDALLTYCFNIKRNLQNNPVKSD